MEMHSKNKRGRVTGATTTASSLTLPPESDPVRYTSGATKTCSFCERPGHTVVHCMVLKQYGALVTGIECRSTLAREINEPSSYETDSMEEVQPTTRVVYQSVPRQAGCVVLLKRYATPVDPSQLVSGHHRMFLECTILDQCGSPMNNEYTNGLFTIEAISVYLLTSVSKQLINRLIPASRETANVVAIASTSETASI
jgi:hypothetical protein